MSPFVSLFHFFFLTHWWHYWDFNPHYVRRCYFPKKPGYSCLFASVVYYFWHTRCTSLSSHELAAQFHWALAHLWVGNGPERWKWSNLWRFVVLTTGHSPKEGTFWPLLILCVIFSALALSSCWFHTTETWLINSPEVNCNTKGEIHLTYLYPFKIWLSNLSYLSRLLCNQWN